MWTVKKRKSWRLDEIQTLRELADEGLSLRQIQDRMELESIPQVTNALYRYNISLDNIKSAGLRKASYKKADIFFTEREKEKQRSAIYNKYRGKAMRWLVLTDLHFPFQSDELIKQALKEKADGIVTSEVFDFYGLSTFRKNQFINISDEIEAGIDFVRKMKERFKNIVWCESNHERRCWKFIQDKMKDRADIMEFIDIEPPVKKIMDSEGVDATTSWWVKIGSVIFCHPDWFSNVTMRTAESTQDFFLKKDRALWGNTECIVNAHTHKVGMAIKYGQVIIENGCCCERMDYLDEGKKRLELQKGYAIIKIEKDGTFNYNDSYLRWAK